MDGSRLPHRVKSYREAQISQDISYMWNKKMVQNEHIYKTNGVTEAENNLMVTRKRRGGGINWEIQIDIYIHYCI